ncbi:MAG: hypothetical protein Fues2KO_26020 [Fuerstiella sp.]
MKTLRKFATALSVVLLAASQSQAVEVIGVMGGAGIGTVFTMGAPVIVTGTENNVTPGPPGAPNSIYIPITVFEKHTPFELLLELEESVAPVGSHTTSYMVTLDLTHAVPGSPASAINGFDITADGAAAPIFHGLAGPLASTFTIEEPQPLPGGTFRFGGLNGGGTGQLLFGDTATSSFELVLTSIAASGPIIRPLVLVANPEPGSILLGSLALVPIGIAVRRRRKQQVVAE